MLIEGLLENIYDSGNQEIADNEQILTLIARLKAKNKLSLVFNVSHKLKSHKSSYPLKLCDNEHCFECLEERIGQGFDTCEHDVKFTAYETVHIKWISEKFKGSE